ncbi:MAG: hypothetical protein ACI8S6_001544 [Myxococcota bacterium]|jgi:hypothetical protein
MSDAARLRAVVSKEPVVSGLLERLHTLNLPQAYIGAGAITQTVWNHLTGQPLGAHRKDIDVVYFDPDDLTEAGEARVLAALVDAAGGVPLDVVNQARVHLWFPEHFGVTIPPFRSTAEAIATWPTPASAVGLSLDGICAPLGLSDLWGLIARPNRGLVSEAAYTAKVTRWQKNWPELTVIPW